VRRRIRFADFAVLGEKSGGLYNKTNITVGF
jgi:hypothetical protein